MKPFISQSLRDDIRRTVQSASDRHLTVNVSALAEEVRRRHVDDNVAVEDIEFEVFQAAQALFAPMEFDSQHVFPVAPSRHADRDGVQLNVTEH